VLFVSLRIGAERGGADGGVVIACSVASERAETRNRRGRQFGENAPKYRSWWWAEHGFAGPPALHALACRHLYHALSLPDHGCAEREDIGVGNATHLLAEQLWQDGFDAYRGLRGSANGLGAPSRAPQGQLRKPQIGP